MSHFSNKEDLKQLMSKIAKKIPSTIVNGDTQVGHITWQMYLMADYLKLDGTPLANASTDYAELLEFAQDNNLITNDTTDNSLFKYNSTTDVLTLPNYIDLVLQGGNSVEEKEAGLPNIKGSTEQHIMTSNGTIIPSSDTSSLYVENASRAFSLSASTSSNINIDTYLYFDASRSNSIYSDNVTTVQPPAIKLIPQIKYRRTTATYENIDLVSYSTEERRIGTWIDGKPLYQITIVISSQSTNSAEYSFSSLGLSNLSNIVNIMAITSYGIPNNAYWTSSNMLRVRRKDDGLEVFAPEQIGDFPLYITLQYTKTTD